MAAPIETGTASLARAADSSIDEGRLRLRRNGAGRLEVPAFTLPEGAAPRAH